MANAHNIARSCGITLLPAIDCPKGPLAPKISRSRAKVMSMAEKYGEQHMIDVLNVIVAAPHNQAELYTSTIVAISLFLREGDYEGMDLQVVKEVIATIDLRELRERTQEVRLRDVPLRMADRLSVLMKEPMI